MPLDALLSSYDPDAPLAEASTLPSAFYLDPAVLSCETKTVFSRSWQVVGRAAQVEEPGSYLTATVAEEPIVVVRGKDGALRAFFNVCRHHAAQVLSAPEGRAASLRCPYHGWTYNLDGSLLGTPDFAGVCGFDRASQGLLPIQAATWGPFVLVHLDPHAPPLPTSLTPALIQEIDALPLTSLHFFERRRYELRCNWKVYVDNYLDGGYHVPLLHKGLGSVLDNARYAISCGPRHCLQHCPIDIDTESKTGQGRSDTATAAVRKGTQALYYWIYPNFMINLYEGVMDTNLVLPLAVDRTAVVFDYYFLDVSPEALPRNRESIAVSERIQDEDVAICESVQRGLASRAYDRGRLSVRREAGEHLFHRLLHADLRAA